MLEKIKQIAKKEVLFYGITLVLLTLLIHSDIVGNPLARIELMQEKENYSHPFLYSFIVYASLLVIRKMIDLIVGIFQK